MSTQDIETILLTMLRELKAKHGFRLPVTITTLARNGSALITRFTAPPAGTASGAAIQEHINGTIDEEGFLAPVYMMAMDATGEVRLAVKRRLGAPMMLTIEDESTP